MGIGRHLVALAVDSIRAAGSFEVKPAAPRFPRTRWLIHNEPPGRARGGSVQYHGHRAV